MAWRNTHSVCAFFLSYQGWPDRLADQLCDALDGRCLPLVGDGADEELQELFDDQVCFWTGLVPFSAAAWHMPPPGSQDNTCIH